MSGRSASVGFAFGVGLLALLPLVGELSLGTYALLIGACLFALYAMSWDLIGGYAGQVVLGQALFVGAGAYGSALLSLQLGWPPLATIPLGAGLAMAVGVLVGVPAVRLRGPYLALATLIALIAASKLVLIYSDVTGGVSGLSFPARSFFPPLGYDVPFEAVHRITYYYVLGILAAIGAGLLALVRSRWGLVLTALREDEAVVAAAGLNPAKFKVAAFMVSALVAGLAGAVSVHLPTSAGVQPSGPGGVLSLDLSLLIIVACVIGGLGTMTGAAVGAFVVVLGQNGLAELVRPLPILGPQSETWITIVFLGLLIGIVHVAPRGLLPALVGRFGRG